MDSTVGKLSRDIIGLLSITLVHGMIRKMTRMKKRGTTKIDEPKKDVC
jgi:hypothetical protein